MTGLFNFVLYSALLIHVLLVALVVWRVWRAENAIDRLIGAELTGTLILAVLMIVSLISRESVYLDVALGLAALGFIGTVSLARYIVDESIF
jgi:multisubunit Na+/H+ antiporter MnhF subunit